MSDNKPEDFPLKKKRSKNFLDEEKEFLMNLVKPYKYIIDNPKTDQMTNSLKSTTWDEIAEQFNLAAKTGPRSGKQLKELYLNIGKIGRRRTLHCVKKDESSFQKDEGIFVYDNESNGDLSTLLNETESLDEQMQENSCDQRSKSVNDTISDFDGDPLDSNRPIVVKSERFFPPIDIFSKDQDINHRDVIRPKRTIAREYADEILELKKQKQLKKLEILDIIKKREQIELEIKEIELEIKKKKFNKCK